jgi:hypothetical protein
MVFRALQLIYAECQPTIKSNLNKIVASGAGAVSEKKPEDKVLAVVRHSRK